MNDLDELVRLHRNLDDEVDKMSKQRYLTPAEKYRLREMKVMRLRYRDRIDKAKIKMGILDV
tara:strand:+ start:758 stop:943 length:186 start_codon:yes stop_codon:yes gene_type:complete